MRNPKYYLTINEYERRNIISSLNNMHKELISDDKYTGAVDDILVKVVYAPIKKFKVSIMEN